MNSDNPPKLTELAKRYGHPKGPEHKAIAFTGQSGLTPIDPLFPNTNLAFADALEKYQRLRFYNFTTQELVDLESFAPQYNGYEVGGKTVDPITLQNFADKVSIHPVYTRDKWGTESRKSHPRFPLPGGRSGFFEARNEIAWQIIEPALRIASQVLFNIHTSEWFSTLFFGKYDFIESEIPDIWKGQKLLRVSKSPINIPDLATKFQTTLKDALRGVVFDFRSAFVDDLTGLPASSPTLGSTRTRFDRRIGVLISFELLLPLLRDDITLAERKTSLFHLAVVLLHETSTVVILIFIASTHPHLQLEIFTRYRTDLLAVVREFIRSHNLQSRVLICSSNPFQHAIWQNKVSQQLKIDINDQEPFFDGDSLNELGYSMEHHVFGGIAMSLTEWERVLPPLCGLPMAGIINTSWLNRDFENYDGKNVPSIPPLPANWHTRELFPLPCGWIEDLHQPEFWNFQARKYPDALRMTKPRYGNRKVYRHAGSSKYDFEAFESFTASSTAATRSQIFATDIENMRRRWQRRIEKAYLTGRDKRKAARLQAQLQDAGSSTLGEAARVRTAGLMSNPNFFEKDEYPACPRWNEICYFLLRNRSQDYLCLDTMPGRFPEHTLWNHIRLFSANPKNIADGRVIDISPEEWRAFLFQCNLRWKSGNKDALMEYITFPPNHRQGGEIKWLKRDAPGYPVDSKPSLRVMRNTTTVISKNTMDLMAEFKAFVLLSDHWHSWFFSDMEFEDLLDEVNDLARSSGSAFRFTDELLRIVIDFYERRMELFCWGPNGVVRPATPPRTPGSTLTNPLALKNQNYDKIGNLKPQTPTPVPKVMCPSSPDSKKSNSSSSSEEGGLTGDTTIFEGELYRSNRNTEPNSMDPKSASPGSRNGSEEEGLTGEHTISAGVVYGPESGSGPGKHFLDQASEVGTRQVDWIGSESGNESGSGDGGLTGDTLFEGEMFRSGTKRRVLDLEEKLKGKSEMSDDDFVMDSG